MTDIAHAQRAHAKLSASGSSRWMNCPGSVQLEEGFEDKGSTYADEGTAAHELSEAKLRNLLGLSETFPKVDSPYYNQEMDEYTDRYVDAVMEQINEALARTSDAQILLEHRLDFSEWVPDGFGTGDVVIIADGLMWITDLKYGKGVEVSAVGNTQMRLYALGALNEFDILYGVDRVRMTIIQPRLDAISTDEITADDLLTWGEEYVKPKAREALSGNGQTAAGDHCKFCKARATCRTRAEAALELAKYEFKEPPLLTVDEVADVLERADKLAAWAKDIQAYALEQAEKHGVRFPGWKLVEGRSNRVITDKEAAVDTLILEGFDMDAIHKPRELKGITDLEKLIGKKQFTAVLGGLIEKPPGKPTLVPESDKRPELSSAASAAADFGEAPV